MSSSADRKVGEKEEVYAMPILDFETSSAVDLTKVGAYVYAAHSSTRILCCAWINGDGTEGWWAPGMDLTSLREAAADPKKIFLAHNAAFEKTIWRSIMVPRYGLPDVPDKRWHCTMAACAARGLPQSLEDAVEVLGLSAPKDVEGWKFTEPFTKPNRKGEIPEPTQADLERIRDYCLADVRATCKLHQAIGLLPEGERETWLIDQQINERGIAVDLALVATMQDVVDQTINKLLPRFAELTGDLKPTQRDKFLAWLRAKGANLPDLTKETVAEYLDAPPEGALLVVIEALTIRQQTGSAAVKKLPVMVRCTAADGRARGQYRYFGGHTGRWAGQLIQPQNLPRGDTKIDPEKLIAAIMTGDPNEVERVAQKPAVVAVANCLRHCFVAKPGHVLVSGDFAQIEARIVLAVAGARRPVELFAEGKPIYEDMASQIFGRPITKEDTEERQIGKNTVLGCGFGMGVTKFHEKYAQGHDLEFCRQVINTYRQSWAPEVPRLWHGLDADVLSLLAPKAWAESYHRPDYQMTRGLIDLERTHDTLVVHLPTGRKLFYHLPWVGLRPRRNEDGEPLYRAGPWGTEGFWEWGTAEEFGDAYPVEDLQWNYRSFEAGHSHSVPMWGGKLVENIVQAIARDLLAQVLDCCEWVGIGDVVMHTHDEVVIEVLEARQEEAERWLKEWMCVANPGRLRSGLQVPIAVEVWSGPRYRK